MSRIEIHEDDPVRIVSEADPGAIEAAILRSQGRKGVLHVGKPTEEQVKVALRHVSSRLKGGLPRSWRKLLK